MQGIHSETRDTTDSRARQTPEGKREILGLLSRTVAHLYALAAACARPGELTPEQRSMAIMEVAEMLMQAYRQLHAMPECAISVLEQCAIVSSAERAPLDDVDIAMVLARSGLVINTWCTAATLTTQTTEGPATIGGLVALLGTMQPDQRYQVALIERLTAAAYDTSAMHQLSTCYLHALEGFSLLELHKLIGVQDMARLRAVDLLDSASRGAVVALHFLARTPLDAHQSTQDPGPEENAEDNRHDVESAPEDAQSAPRDAESIREDAESAPGALPAETQDTQSEPCDAYP